MRTLLGMLFGCVWVLAGCTDAGLRDAQFAYRAGDLDRAGAQIDAFAAEHGDDKDRVVAFLEQGAIHRARGDVNASLAAWARADDAIEAMEDEPDVSLSREALASLTNLSTLDYRAKHHERIMLSAYMALNYMELGDGEAARVELYRAYLRQQEAVAAQEERLAKAQDAAAEADVARAMESEHFQALMESEYGQLRQYRVYTDYVNPFVEWLQGVFYTTSPDGADWERGRVSLRRALGMIPDNPYLADDLEAAERLAETGQLDPTTYVIFETGTGPWVGSMRVDLPLFLFNDAVDYVGVSFPYLVFNNRFVRKLSVRAEGKVHTTYEIASMDSIVSQEFENDLPIVITRTLISASAKAAAAFGLHEATREEEWLNALTRVAATVYQMATNEADTRCWASLPKEFQYARFPRPRDGVVIVEAPGFAPASIELVPGRINVVLVKSIGPDSPLVIGQFALQ